MNEFEKEMLSLLKGLDNRISSIENDMNLLKNDMAVMKDDISEMKENLNITRTAANYNGEKLEELIAELKASNTIA